MMRTRLKLPLLVLVVLLAAGCATATPSPSPFVAATPPPPPGEYVVQPGDTLAVKFYYHPDHDQEVIVRTDGKIVLNLVGEMQAAGLTPAAIAERVTAAYATTLRDPKIAVSVKSMNEKRVYVGGEVNRPGFIVYREGLTAVQAMLEAGGPKDTGRVDEVVFLQMDGGKGYRPSKLNLAKILENGDVSGDQPLAPADVIYVPKTTIAKIDVFMEQYLFRVLPLRPSASMLLLP